jgi:Txe/YoeB family toxin of Txe-Axe toxin-antitoxin module
MESLQETFILEQLKNDNSHNQIKKYNLDELSSYLNLLLNKESPTGSDMKAIAYLFDNLFSIGLKKDLKEKGLSNLSKKIQNCVKKMEQLQVKSKEGFIYITDFFSSDIQVVIKIPQNSNSFNSKVREYFIGIRSLNNLRYLTPTFVYTLGAFSCPKPSKKGKIGQTNKITPYVLYEKVPGDSFHTLLKNDKLDFKKWLILFFQLLLGLEIAQRESRFTHFDMHSDNVMVRSDNVSTYTISLDMTTYTVNDPESVPVIIDFGASTTYIEGKYIGCYDYIKHGMLNFMVPGHDMYKFMISSIRKTTNKKLKEKLISLFHFYQKDDDPYSIVETGEDGVNTASDEYCKRITFSKVANYTPLMFIEWLCEHKEFSNELSSIIRVSKRENYVSIKYSNIIREYENIFSCIKNEQNNPEKIIELGHTCLKKIPSYVMCKYIITILERYNTFAESEDLKVKVTLLKKNIKKSKSFLLQCDLDMLNNVFSIEMPSQEDFDQCVSEILNIPIRHPNAKEKEEAVKKLETLLFYQNELNHYLQFYFTILELGLEKNFKDFLKKFKTSTIYFFHINNITQTQRAIRWGQTLLASII